MPWVTHREWGGVFKRRPLVVAAGILLCLWAVVIVVALRRSGRADDLSDLVPSVRQAVAASNAIPLLLSASDALPSHKEIDRLWYSLTNKARVNKADVSALLTTEAEPVRLFRAAMLRPDCIWTNPASPFDEVFSHGTNWSAIFRLMLAGEEMLTIEKDPAAAVSSILDGMRFANRIGESGAGMPGMLAAASMKSLATRSLKRLAHDPRTPDAALREAVIRLGSLSFSPAMASNVIKEELVRSVAETDAVVRGQGPLAGLQYDPKATARLLAPPARAALQSLNRSYLDSPAALYHPPRISMTRSFASLASGNITGETLRNSMGYGLTRIIERRCSYDNIIKSTRLILGLLLYERANGRLPETLGELVPQFIDEVPADGFDGKPLRYSRERRLVWSVGRDGKDDGGILRIPGTNKDGDQLYPLE